LEQLKVDLWLEQGQLRFRAPSGAMSESVRRSMSLHKTELLRIYHEAAKLSAHSSTQEFGDEDLPLTPNQVWYLSTFEPEGHAWALTIALDAPWPVSEYGLRATVRELVQEHDVFRLRLYRKPDGNWAQRILPRAEEIQIAAHDMAGLEPKARHRAIHEAGHRAQLSLNILRGPVIALALCRCGKGEPDKIIIALHHHVVDGYSLNLFIAELLHVYQACMSDPAWADRGSSVRPKAGSYRSYLTALHTYTHQLSVVARALAFWCDPDRLGRLPQLPVDIPNGQHTDVNSRRISMPLEPALRHKVVKYIQSRKEGYSFNDLLLCGLAHAFFRWTGQRSLRLDLEYHVRIGLLPGMDLLSTIGPATIKFPMLLTVNPDGGIQHDLQQVRSSVRETVDNALGYGFLRYTCTDPEIRQQLSACARPQVFVNNRSTLGAGKATDQAQIATKSMSFPQPGVRENPVSYDLMITCDSSDDRVVLTWVYSSAIHHEQTIRTLSSYFFASLHALTQGSDSWA
jgi:non-ribosomal peptide synthase protein (TIGR01720 family)